MLAGIDEVADDAVNGVNHEVDVDGGLDTVVAESLAHAGPDLQDNRCQTVRMREQTGRGRGRGRGTGLGEVKWETDGEVGDVVVVHDVEVDNVSAGSDHVVDLDIMMPQSATTTNPSVPLTLASALHPCLPASH